MTQWFKNIVRRIRIWFKLQSMQADIDVLDAVKRGIKRIERETTEACEHELIHQLIRKDMWYQCMNKKCGAVFFIHGVQGWDQRQIPHLFKVLKASLSKVEQAKLETLEIPAHDPVSDYPEED